MDFTRALSHAQASSNPRVRFSQSTSQVLKQPALRGRVARLPAVRPAAVAEMSRAAAPAPVREASPLEDDLHIVNVASREQFGDLLQASKDKMVVLMCKAKGCHPCKTFRTKYGTLAQHYADAVFVEVMGDRNESTRSMMKAMKVRATPTFVVFRGGEQVHSHSGANARKLIDALGEQCPPAAAGAGVDASYLEKLLRDVPSDDE